MTTGHGPRLCSMDFPRLSVGEERFFFPLGLLDGFSLLLADTLVSSHFDPPFFPDGGFWFWRREALLFPSGVGVSVPIPEAEL